MLMQKAREGERVINKKRHPSIWIDGYRQRRGKKETEREGFYNHSS